MSQTLSKEHDETLDSPLPKPPIDFATIEVPKHLTALWIVEDVVIYSKFKRPNAWRRFWTWAFFGWRWTKVVPSKDTG